MKRAATVVAKNMSAGVQKNNELQRKLLIELRKARETQEAANEIDVIKYASSSIRQAYADTRAHQLMCKANADKKRAELELIQVTAELAKAKKTMMTDEDEASDVREDDRVRVDHQDLAQDHREGLEGLAAGSPKNEDEMQDDGEEDLSSLHLEVEDVTAHRLVVPSSTVQFEADDPISQRLLFACETPSLLHVLKPQIVHLLRQPQPLQQSGAGSAVHCMVPTHKNCCPLLGPVSFADQPSYCEE